LKFYILYFILLKSKLKTLKKELKMKKVLFFLSLLATAILLSSCMPVASHLQGGILTDVKGPLMVSSNAGKPSKVGTATATTYLGLVAQGDASIETAAKNAGITRIHHVDYQAKSTLGIIATFTVTVYGD
jgi:hypothetical protein